MSLQPRRLSPMCEKARGAGGGHEGLARLCVGCRVWGGVQPLIQWKRQCCGVGSVTRLCKERGEGRIESKGVYTQGIRGHYCRLFRASTSLSRQRENTEPLTVCHRDKPFHECLPLSPSSPQHPMHGLAGNLPFHSVVQSGAFHCRGLEDLPFSVFEGGKAQSVGHLRGRHGLLHVLLVCKNHQDGFLQLLLLNYKERKKN